ncbi:MAG: periplasmic heavy metal sensor [Sneathiella sp.]|nr:periplasmic heavy metal sensor [Sneathiella sp.]
MAISKSRILLVAFLISFALNLAVAGFVAAQWFHHKGMQGQPQIGLTFDRRAAFDVLEKEEQKKIHKIWRAKRSDMRERFKEYREAKRTLSKFLSAKKLNQEDVTQAYDNMTAHRNAIEAILNMTLVDTAKALRPEIRAKFFKSGFQRWKSRHKRGEQFRKYREEHHKHD